jgi:hypothetical protein
MAFPEVAVSCAGMAAVVRIDVILKWLFPIISSDSATGLLFSVPRFFLSSLSDFQTFVMPMMKRTSFVSMILSYMRRKANQMLQAINAAYQNIGKGHGCCFLKS